MIAFGFLLGMGWKKLFIDNDEFLISGISLETFEGEETEFLTYKRLVEETQLDKEATIFSLDTTDLRDRLLDFPEITEARVGRRLPGKLIIEVTERQPVAWLACRALGIVERDRELGLLVDQNNIPFRCASDSLWKFSEKLPVVMVPSAGAGEIVIGEPVSHVGLGHAFELVALAGDILEERDSPAWVIVEDEITLKMKTMSGILATFSYYELERQLESLSRSSAHAEMNGRSIARINLIPKRYVPVHYQ